MVETQTPLATRAPAQRTNRTARQWRADSAAPAATTTPTLIAPAAERRQTASATAAAPALRVRPSIAHPSAATHRAVYADDTLRVMERRLSPALREPASDNLPYDLYDQLSAIEHASTTARLAAIAASPASRPAPRIRHTSAQPPVRVSAARRVGVLTTRLAELGAIRPAVRIPGRSATPNTASATRVKKLPPLWLLTNIAILIVAAIAILPRAVQSIDAAAACDWHTVVPGDTLGNLGSAHHTNALAIAHANHINNPDLIFVGQRLCIPTTDWAQANAAPAVPAPAQPPNYGSASGVANFINFALPYTRSAHDQTGWPVSLILAQWGLEQGWRTPSYTGFNFGTVAALPGEPTINGIATPGSPAAFAYAHTPQDGLRYYVRVAHLGYYSAVAPTARQYGADAAARALGRSPWDAGHYTDHGDPGSSLVSILRVYNLYWYDTH